METPEIFMIRQLERGALEGERERERVLKVLRSALPFANVREVGSTAVDGVIGKQDMDFAVRVPPEKFTVARGILDGLFPRNVRQLSNAEYQGYIVPSTLDVALQLFHSKGRYDVFDAFIDLLGSEPDLRRAYNDLKTQWNGKPMGAYRAAKDAFIEAALKRANSSRAASPGVVPGKPAGE